MKSSRLITEANSLKEFVDDEIAGLFPLLLPRPSGGGTGGPLFAAGGHSLTPQSVLLSYGNL